MPAPTLIMPAPTQRHACPHAHHVCPLSSSFLPTLLVIPAHPPRHSCEGRNPEGQGKGGATQPPTTVAKPRIPILLDEQSPNRPPPTQRPFALSLSKGRAHPAIRLLAPARWPTLPCPHGSRTQPPRKDPRPPASMTAFRLPKAGNCFTTIASLALDLYLQCVTTATKRMHKHEPSQLRPTRKAMSKKARRSYARPAKQCPSTPPQPSSSTRRRRQESGPSHDGSS